MAEPSLWKSIYPLMVKADKKLKLAVVSFNSTPEKSAGKKNMPALPQTSTPVQQQHDDDAVAKLSLDDWCQEELNVLTQRVTEAQQLKPKRGVPRKYTATMNKINWDNIAFGEHTAEECHHMMDLLLKKVRTFRTLPEMLVDVQAYVKDLPSVANAADIPKRPRTPFFIFLEERRAGFKNEHPEYSASEVIRELSEMYHNLSPTMKKKYMDAYQKAKTEYNAEMEQFYAEHPDMDNRNTGKSTHRIPKSAFRLYCEERSTKPSWAAIPSDERNKMMKAAWDELKDKKKAKYIRQHLEEIKEYEEWRLKFIEEHPDEAKPKEIKGLPKDEQAVLDRMEGKPRRPNGAYQAFYSEMTKDPPPHIAKLPPSERTKAIGAMWTNMSEEEKKPYLDKAASELQEYKEQYGAYLVEHPEAAPVEAPKKKRPLKAKKRTAFDLYFEAKREQTLSEMPRLNEKQLKMFLRDEFAGLKEKKREKWERRALAMNNGENLSDNESAEVSTLALPSPPAKQQSAPRSDEPSKKKLRISFSRPS